MHTRCVRLSQEYIRFPRLLVYIDDIDVLNRGTDAQRLEMRVFTITSSADEGVCLHFRSVLIRLSTEIFASFMIDARKMN